jgi:membrane protease YdiL (CAAX protease family)
MKKISNLNQIFFYVLLIYIAIFLQYPVSLALGHFALRLDLFHQIQPMHLLYWGAIRVFIIMPLIFSLLFAIDSDTSSIYLRFGDRSRMIKFTFWGTLTFILLGILFYPYFLNTSKLTLNSFFYLIPFFSLYAISNAFVEEIFFRGSLLAILTKKYSFWFSNLIQATLFAFIHLINPMSSNLMLFVLLTFVLGLFWGYITRASKSLIPAIILHIIADIFVAISLF